MKRKKVDSSQERRLLMALIMSKPFLAQAAPVIDLELINAPHFKQVAQWCLEYFNEYGEAPKQHIEDVYHAWAEDNTNEELVDSIHDFLEALSSQYDEAANVNVGFLVDELGEFLTKRKIQRLQEDLEYTMLQGNHKEAESALLEYRTVTVGQGKGFDPLNDDAVWALPFAEKMEPLISFPGDAGRFFNPAMTRGGLIAIQAPEKTGKTWWCVEFVMQALRNRKKVALFEVGDLSTSEILLRLGVRWARRPLWKRQCGDLEVPSKIKRDDEEDWGYSITQKTENYPAPVTRRSIKRGRRKFRRGCGLPTDTSYIKTSVHPNSSINVREIDSILDGWAMDEDFIPDIIVIDYADILKPEDEKKDARHQVNDTWKALRRLSQERHALVIVPTQADAASFSQEVTLQTMKNFTEDKRKLSHVTGMLALNQTPGEKEIGGMRVNWIVLRESPFNIQRCLYVGTCFALGRSICCATL